MFFQFKIENARELTERRESESGLEVHTLSVTRITKFGNLESLQRNKTVSRILGTRSTEYLVQCTGTRQYEHSNRLQYKY